jgi:SHS2 domain-containing protein
MPEERPRFRALPHTADQVIEAYGDTLAEAFANAAYGMFSLEADLEAIRETETFTVDVAGATREELLLNWLRELLFLSESRSVVPCAFRVETIDDTRLRAQVSAGPLTESVRLGAPAKAITYHDLAVTETDGWTVRVTLDV